MEVKRVFDILDNLKITSQKHDILNAKENKKWVSYSVTDFVSNSNYVSSALLHLGLQKNDKVAIMAGNMPAWNFVDYGSQQVAMPSAPIFPTISQDDLKYILNHCEAKIIFISEKSTYQKLVSLENELPHLKHVISFTKIDGVKSFSDFLELGKQHLQLEKIESIKKEYTSEDFEVHSYNVDESPELVSMYSIRSVPTIIFLKDEDEVERIIGLTNKRDLETQIKKHLYFKFFN